MCVVVLAGAEGRPVLFLSSVGFRLWAYAVAGTDVHQLRRHGEMMHFPISGVETYWWLPLLFGFGISCLSSMGGVSGAFLLLPFQISVLGFTGPAVSPTNLIYNIISIPSGVYRYYRERRMVWPLAWLTIIGTLPGVFLGAIVRVRYLPDPESFKPFAGLVLLYIAGSLLRDLVRRSKGGNDIQTVPHRATVRPLETGPRRLGYEFAGRPYYASTGSILLLSFLVGLVGGAYGIGGGAIIAPFLVAMFGLPIYTIAGAALLGTFFTSITGVVFYLVIAAFWADPSLPVAPDWLLGGMFGLGGAAGMYVGARMQRYVPARAIKAILSAMLLFVAVKYIMTVFG